MARKLHSVENPDRQIQGCGYAHPKGIEEHGPGPGLFCKKYLIYQPYGSRKVEQNENLARKGQFQSEEKKTPKHVEDAVYSRRNQHSLKVCRVLFDTGVYGKKSKQIDCAPHNGEEEGRRPLGGGFQQGIPCLSCRCAETARHGHGRYAQCRQKIFQIVAHRTIYMQLLRKI